MEQTGGAQGDASGTSMDVRLCQAVQFLVERREQRVLGRWIAGIDTCSKITDQIRGFVAYVLALD